MSNEDKLLLNLCISIIIEVEGNIHYDEIFRILNRDFDMDFEFTVDDVIKELSTIEYEDYESVSRHCCVY